MAAQTHFYQFLFGFGHLICKIYKNYEDSSKRKQFRANFARMRILGVITVVLMMLTSFVPYEARFINTKNYIIEPRPHFLVKLKGQPMVENSEERKKFVDQMFSKASFSIFIFNQF